MPYLDCYWPLKLLGAPLAAALAVAGPLWYLATVLPIDRARGWSSTPDVAFAAGLAAFFALVALYLLVSGLRGRKRMARRRLAIAGQADAVPRSSVEADPAAAPDVSQQPLELLWRAQGLDRVYDGCFLGCVGVVCALVGGIYFFLSLASILSGSKRWMAMSSSASPGLVLVGMLAVGLTGLWILSTAMPALLGVRFGVVATQEGLTQHRRWGRTRTIPWSDVRLFEISMSDWKTRTASPRYLALHSQRTSLIWRDDWRIGTSSHMAVFTPDGITRGEMWRRKVLLLDLIAARTGLQPRTFCRRLGATVESPGRLAVQPLRASLFLLLYCAACVALVPLAPLSTVRWLNYLVIATVGSLAVFSLFIAFRALRDLLRPLVVDPTFAYAHRAPDTTASADAEAVWLMWLVRPRWRYLPAVAGGVLLCINFVPVLALWFPGLFGWLQAPPPLIGAGLPTALAFALLVPALAGPILILTVVLTRRVLYWANASGIGVGYPLNPIEIPWSQVTSIVVDLRHGQPRQYTVLGRSGTLPIAFPASAETLPAPHGGARPITPAELAELVARRAGVPISRRE